MPPRSRSGALLSPVQPRPFGHNPVPRAKKPVAILETHRQLISGVAVTILETKATDVVAITVATLDTEPLHRCHQNVTTLETHRHLATSNPVTSIGVTIVARATWRCHHWCHRDRWAQHRLSPPQPSLGDSMITPGHPHLSPFLPVQRRRQPVISLHSQPPRLCLPLVIKATGHQPASPEKSLALATSPTTPATSPDSRQDTP